MELRLAAIVDRGGTEVVVDLAEARSIDPAVVDVLLLTAKELRGAGGELLLAAAVEGRDSYVLKAVEPEDLANVMGLHPALDRALAELRRQVPAVTASALVDSA